MRLNTENLKAEEKKLKRHYKEKSNLYKIITYVKTLRDYHDLYRNPFSKIYGFEVLKHEMSGFISFNLNKSGGVIRLICSIDMENNILKIEFISLDHYNDFIRRLR